MNDLKRILENRPRYSLEELARQANDLLQEQANPEAHDRRVKAEVNPRLIRHYVSENLLDPALREGRKALYSTDHLLQLLALRRMLADGYSSKMIGDALRQLDRDELVATIQHGAAAAGSATRTPAETAIAERRAAARATLDAIRQRSAGTQPQQTSSAPQPPADHGTAVPIPHGHPQTQRQAPPQEPPTATSREPLPGAPPAPALASAPTGEPTSHWERVPLLDGVELHVRSDVRLPASLADQQVLLDYVIRQLVLYAQRRS